MHPILPYLLKMLLCSGILYGYYRVALYNERFHQWNRFYLLGALALSVTIPLIQIPIPQKSQSPVIYFIIETVPSSIAAHTTPLLSTQQIVFIAAACISIILLIKMVVGLYRDVFKPLKDGELSAYEDISIVMTQKPSAPYSFFRWLFWRNDLLPDSPHGQSILQHEMTHIREKHSFDKLFTELLLILCWYNPFFWMMRKELYAIHEFLADRKAVGHGNGAAFAQMILHNMHLRTISPIASPFFSSQIKRRLQMITTSKKASYSYMRRLTALTAMLIVSISLMLSAEKSMAQKNDADPVFKNNPNTEELYQKMLDATVIFENKVIPKDSVIAFFETHQHQRLSITYLSEAEGKKRFDKAGEKGVMLIWLEPEEKRNSIGLDEIVVVGRKNKNGDFNNKTVSVSLKDYNLPSKPVADILTIVDGIEMPDAYLNKIEAKDIAEIKWLDPETAIEKYGIDGSKGAQEVELKKSEFAMAYINLAHMPQFPGGEAAWNAYVEKNLAYPPMAIESKTEGKVLVQCRVDVLGKLSSFKILENPGNGLGEEALRIVKQSPDWIPGQQSGKWVPAKITIPIQFTIK
jgi:TonB family protein